MNSFPVWEVTLHVYGPITVKNIVRLNEPKGYRLRDPFYSDIEINPRPRSDGVKAIVTAFASNEKLAYKAALLFFGQMLDVLSFHIDQPLFLSLLRDHRPNFSRVYETRRRVERDEWREAFRESRLLALAEPVFLRALGWYRKGLYSEDPFDKFIAFWNSIENVTAKYHPPIPDDRPSGSKSQMWESFKCIWGDCDDWPIIPGQLTWIDENYNIRVEIAHGVKPINIETVENVINRIETLRQVAHRFLTDWRQEKLDLKIPPDMRQIYGYDT